LFTTYVLRRTPYFVWDPGTFAVYGAQRHFRCNDRHALDETTAVYYFVFAPPKGMHREVLTRPQKSSQEHVAFLPYSRKAVGHPLDAVDRLYCNVPVAHLALCSPEIYIFWQRRVFQAILVPFLSPFSFFCCFTYSAMNGSPRRILR
jgi:hypothetical protein